MSKEFKFKIGLQRLKDAVAEHNDNRKWWQPEWKLIENALFFSICYNDFPNPLNLHKTIYGWSWSAFPKEHHAILKPESLYW